MSDINKIKELINEEAERNEYINKISHVLIALLDRSSDDALVNLNLAILDLGGKVDFRELLIYKHGRFKLTAKAVALGGNKASMSKYLNRKSSLTADKLETILNTNLKAAE